MKVNILSYLNQRVIICDYYLKNDPEEYKRIVLTTNVIILVGLSTIVLGISEAVNGFYGFLFVDIFAFCSSLLALWCIRIGKKNLAVDIIMTVFVVAMGVNTSLQGRESGNYLLYFPIMASVIFISPIGNPWKVRFWLIMLGSMFLIQEMYDYRLIPSYHYPMENIKFTYHTNLITSFVITMVLILELVKINAQTEKKLTDLNLTLLKSNKELQKTNSELDTFVYRASHDIRSPISTAKGLILISKNETDIDQIKTYLDLQEKSLNKLDSFVTAILSHSRNSRAEIALEPIAFKQMIDEIIHYSFTFELQQSSDCIIDIDDKIFYSDPARMQIIFINLIENAVKYRNTSRVPFELGIKIEQVNDFLQISIQDNGVGIPADLQPRIFEMFFRATQLSSGSGLGLYIVKEAIEKLGGNISVKSQMGKGTTFEIILPCKKPAKKI